MLTYQRKSDEGGFGVSELIRDGDLTIRCMLDEAADYAVMAKWLSDPRVLEFYEGRDNAFTLERIMEKYSPRVLRFEGVTPCLLMLAGAPIGYIQYYPEPEAEAPGTFGIDQVIGEPDLWDQGIGTRAVSLLLTFLFQREGAAKVITDPRIDNLRAIRCYEKCGFRKVRILPGHELHEGSFRDSWLMEVTAEGLPS
jgi:aminoglycoside 6'-N-acetyltransferase